MLRLLPWLLVLLAALGAAWMLVDAAGPFGGGALERDGAAGDDPFLDGAGGPWEETWDEAPRLVGVPGAARAADRPGGSAASGPGGPGGAGAAGAAGGGAVVRFGGTVSATDGRPVAGITVTIKGMNGALVTAETKENGRFAVEIPAGRYDLLFKGEGVGGLAWPRYLVDGATGVDVEFKLRRTWRLSVTLHREGRPFEGARVEASSRTGLGGETTETDASGAATFEELVAGTYDVVATMKEHEDARRRVDLRKDVALKIDVPPGVAIHGTVQSAEDGSRVENAEVVASVKLASGTWVTATAQTDLNGDYEVEVPKGYVGRFTIAAADYAPWPSRRKIRTVLQSLRGVAKGQTTQRDASLTRGFLIAGTVKDAEGKGVEGVNLRFKPRRAAALEATTGEDGAYEVGGVQVERYDVVVLNEGYFPEHALRVTVPRGLTPGDVVDFDIVVNPTIEILGRVVHKGDKPAAGARVWITGGGRLLRAAHGAGRMLETFTDTDGYWRLSDLPANQGVAARASLGTLQARPRGFRTNELPDQPLELVLAQTVELSGRVVDITTRNPVANARVLIRPRGGPGGRTVRSVNTNAKGEFLARELIPGAWQLTPSKGGYLKADPQEKVLDKKDTEVEVELYLDPGLSIAGHLYDPRGTPLDSARVYVSGTDRSGKYVRLYAKTAKDGAFRVTGLLGGAYSLRARRGGYRNVTVNDLQGGEDRLQITMQPRNKKP